MINLVNDVEFGKKESFMSILEEPLRKSGSIKLHLFFDRAVSLGAVFNAATVTSVTTLASVAAESFTPALSKLRSSCQVILIVLYREKMLL
jgi:hypothetical protein